MSELLDFVKDNQLLAGSVSLGTIGPGIAWLFNYFRKRRSTSKGSATPDSELALQETHELLERVKPQFSILFVDDKNFRIVEILVKAGWTSTKLIKDVRSLDDAEIRNVDLFFIDIQGVGKSLGFKDEGLGLVSALKKKYPDKKVVIYSSVEQGTRFHEAFRICDDQLPKNADPYEFQQIVEKFAAEKARGK